MKYLIQCMQGILSLVLIGTMISCATPPGSSEESMPTGDAKALPSEVEVSHIEGTLVVPGTDFSRYEKLMVTALDVDNVRIISPNADKPWTLSEQNKRFFREQYIQAAVINLIADNAYATSLDPGEDVLVLRSRIIQIAPAAAVDAAQGRPSNMQVYSDSSGIVTISMELYDSVTEKLLGTITDTRDVGRIWDENDYGSTSLQINQAFIYWLTSLRTELDTLSRKQTPLDKLLIR